MDAPVLVLTLARNQSLTESRRGAIPLSGEDVGEIAGSERSAGPERLDACSAGHEDSVGSIGGEHAVADNAYQIVDVGFESVRIVHCETVDVEDDVAVVRYHALPPFRLATESGEPTRYQAARHRDDLHRNGVAAATQNVDPFAVIDDADEALTACGDDLLASQRGASTLDQCPARFELVGAVDVDAQRARCVGVNHAYAMLLQALRGGF